MSQKAGSANRAVSAGRSDGTGAVTSRNSNGNGGGSGGFGGYGGGNSVVSAGSTVVAGQRTSRQSFQRPVSSSEMVGLRVSALEQSVQDDDYGGQYLDSQEDNYYTKNSSAGAGSNRNTRDFTEKPILIPKIRWEDIFIVDPLRCTIGKGSFGVVIRAVLRASLRDQPIMDHKVAIKLMAKAAHELEQDEKDHYLRTAVEEAGIVIDVRNKMILKDTIIDIYGVADGVLPFHLSDALNIHENVPAIGIIMRYEGGGSLSKLIYKRDRTRESIPMVEKLRLLAGLAQGLAELHSSGIVHGDVKPDNILLSSDSPPQIRLADFGLSTMRKVSEVTNSSLRETVHIRGTPIYCAPGKQIIYSIICIELLTLLIEFHYIFFWFQKCLSIHITKRTT